MSRTALELIGQSGFGYSFDALSDGSNALADAFAAVFATASTFRFMIILATWFPILRKFVSRFPEEPIISYLFAA